MKESTMSAKISFMNHWNIAGALVSPNGITKYSKVPYQVQKVVFHSSPSLMQILLYPAWRSIFE